MNGIDISGWQKDLNLEVVPCNFVIIKATQGVKYTSKTFKEQIDKAIALGKLVGVYHYAGGGGVEAEADYFLSVVKDYIGKAILCFDWEGEQNPNFGNPSYAMSWLKYVKKKTGITPFLYMSKSVCRQYDWTAVKGFPLWCAQYANRTNTGYKREPWTDSKGFGAWKSPAIYQYSANGRLTGYNANLDLDKAYISAEEWKAYASGETVVDNSKKSNEEIAAEVVAGLWGNGDERKKRLSEAGYDYSAIQAIVNDSVSPAKKSLDEVAREVVKGLWGNGATRKKKLSEAGYDYAAVQKRVDKLLRG